MTRENENSITSQPAREEIPLYEPLCKMQVAAGECLDHFHSLWELHLKHNGNPYVLCMGARYGKVLHCWLEAGEIAVDLTFQTGCRFYWRSDFYSQFRITDGDVRRYSFIETFVAYGEHNQRILFWDFNTDEYFTTDLTRDL